MPLANTNDLFVYNWLFSLLNLDLREPSVIHHIEATILKCGICRSCRLSFSLLQMLRLVLENTGKKTLASSSVQQECPTSFLAY